MTTQNTSGPTLRETARRLGISRVEVGRLLHDAHHGDPAARAEARERLRRAKAEQVTEADS